jgi:hypothetical protein
MGEEQGTVPKEGVPDDDSSGKLSYPTPPDDPIDTAGPEGTREAGKLPPKPGKTREGQGTEEREPGRG